MDAKYITVNHCRQGEPIEDLRERGWVGREGASGKLLKTKRSEAGTATKRRDRTDAPQAAFVQTDIALYTCGLHIPG